MASNQVSKPQVSKPQIGVYAHMATEAAAASLKSSLEGDAYLLKVFLTYSDFVEAVEARQGDIDCIVLDAEERALPIFEELRSRSVLLPTILIKDSAVGAAAQEPDILAYQTIVQDLESHQLDQLSACIDKVIGQFLKMPLDEKATQLQADIDDRERALLIGRQRRLAEKLKERLGYLGVYYKRDPNRFLRYMPLDEKKQLLAQLKQGYQEIILNYFTEDPLLNQKIDNYINSAFFADVPVVQIVEIHMDLMDEFSKQLKLEGRSEEILLDYRLTLIDTLSNLCEMYRRSIPQKT